MLVFLQNLRSPFMYKNGYLMLGSLAIWLRRFHSQSKPLHHLSWWYRRITYSSTLTVTVSSIANDRFGNGSRTQGLSLSKLSSMRSRTSCEGREPRQVCENEEMSVLINPSWSVPIWGKHGKQRNVFFWMQRSTTTTGIGMVDRGWCSVWPVVASTHTVPPPVYNMYTHTPFVWFTNSPTPQQLPTH